MNRTSLSNRKYLLFIFAVILSIQIFNPNKSQAINSPAGWSWTSSIPFVFNSTKVSATSSSWCEGHHFEIEVDGESNKKDVCIITDDGIRFGFYCVTNRVIPVIGFALDSKMYVLGGISDSLSDVIYSPSNDLLIVKRHLTNNVDKSFVIYKNFSGRLSRYYDFIKKSLGYTFDASNPDYIFQSDNGLAWSVGGIGISDNGEWLAIEFKGNGIGLLDLSNLRMKLVTDYSYKYGIGYNPTVEIAVSNDGKYLAAVGKNAGFKMYEIDSKCGSEIDKSSLENVSKIKIRCTETNFSTSLFIDRFKYATLPKFNDNGGEINFVAISYTGEKRAVSLRASGYDNRKLEYLALGDSFTSGEGETDDKYYLKGTNDEFEKCHISLNSYPYLLTDMMGIDVSNMATVACSGAEMKDVLGEDTDYLGQGRRLGKNFMNLSASNMALSKTDARLSFIPGRIHQETFVKEYTPESISVSIGGNDAGLMGKLASCLNHDTCSWADTEKGRAQTAQEIRNLFPKLVKTYQKIHEDSPNSRIYVIGYPKIIDQNNRCDLINGYMLDQTERRFMNESIIYLNSVISAAARSVGVRYIDIKDSFGDHLLCGNEKPSAMNAVRFGDDISISDKYSDFKPIGSESFHPNPLGHSYTADMIFGDVDDFLTNDYCLDSSVICPDKTVTAPEPSKYWKPAQNNNYPTLKKVQCLADAKVSDSDKKKYLSLNKGSLQPDSNVTIEISSKPRILGEYTVNSDGSLDIDIELPTDMEYGYHTIHIYGHSYSQEPVELYEVFHYEQPVYDFKKQPEVTSNKTNSSNTNQNIKVKPDTDNNLGTTASNNTYPNDSDIVQAKSDSKGQIKGLTDEQRNTKETNSISINQSRKASTDNSTLLMTLFFAAVILVVSLFFTSSVVARKKSRG